MAAIPITIFGAAAAAACAALVVAAVWRTGEVLSPWIVFLAMTAFDVFLPASLYFSIGSPLRDAIRGGAEIDWTIGPAVLIAGVSVALFACGYTITGSTPRARGAARPPMASLISPHRAYLVLIVASVVYIGGIAAQLSMKGSVEAFVADTLSARFRGTAVAWTEVGVWPKAFLPVAFMAIGVLFSAREKAPFVRGIVLPVLGLVLAVTTFFRGTILNYAIGLILIETERRRDRWTMMPARISVELRRSLGPVIVIGAVSVVCFLGYGAARNFLTNRAEDPGARPEAALQFELSRVVRGEGLIGIAAIVDYYPRKRAFLNGKTIRDMLLLPIPRAIWPEKPLWYGIDDITRGMGWSQTSQSAVTMPGELYANFGYPGIPLMLVWGALFGVFRRYRHGSRFRFLYAFLLVPMMFTTCWMAFTGFMNGLVALPLLTTAVLIMVPIVPRAEPGEA
jgi:hypothetical protein